MFKRSKLCFFPLAGFFKTITKNYSSKPSTWTVSIIILLRLSFKIRPLKSEATSEVVISSWVTLLEDLTTKFCLPIGSFHCDWLLSKTTKILWGGRSVNILEWKESRYTRTTSSILKALSSGGSSDNAGEAQIHLK